MKNLDHSIIDILLECELFESCSRKDLARMVPFIERTVFKKGSHIYNIDKEAENVYILLSGEVGLFSERRKITTITSGSFGEEAIRRDGKYLLNAEVIGDADVLSVPHHVIEDVITSSPGLKDSLYSGIVNHFSFHKLSNLDKPKEKEEKNSSIKVIGWIVSMIAPVLIFIFREKLGLVWEQGLFAAVGVSAVLMWTFRLVGEFIPSIMAVLVILVLQIAPTHVALSGFMSGSFFMAMSIFGISALLVLSGLAYRMVINILRIVPMSQKWHAAAIFFTGILLTPILPSANGRIALGTPLLIDLIESLGYKKKGKAATFLSIATFSGFTMFSSVFLSSKAIHFVVFGLLPTQIQHQFSWSYWLYASLPAFVIMLVLFTVTAYFFFNNDEDPQLNKELIELQRIVLGPLTTIEWASLGGIFLFAVGIATSSLHKIYLPWVGLAVLYVVLVLGYLTKNDFKSKIDWSFLVFLGTLIGFAKSMSATGVDVIIGKKLTWLGNYMRSDIELFILLLIIIIILLRFFIPNNATVAIMASVFFPLAEINGINTWIIAFVILIMSDAWFFPHQSTFYILFRELLAGKRHMDTKKFLTYNGITVLFRIAAVYISLPFWRMIGLL